MDIGLERHVKVADAVFVGAALLHIENPARADFSLQELEERTVREHLWHGNLGSISAHISRHCVANAVPNGGAYAILFETRKSMRRLLLPGDPIDPARLKGKKWPAREALPPKYAHLVEWAQERYESASKNVDLEWLGSLTVARGLGRTMANGASADEYVKSLREDWQ